MPTDAQLEIEASDRLNPDEDGRSLPTRLHVYQLTDLSRLLHASFDDLWTRPKDVLGESAVSAQELIVYPGQVLVQRFKREARAQYLVAVAVFRDPEGEAWRTAQAWPAPGDPCRASGKPEPVPSKLRVRVFLQDNQVDSVNNYARLLQRRCAGDCDDEAGLPAASDLRRNRRLRTFEEDPREPEITPAEH